MASGIHFKYWKNIFISRLYEQFSRNDSTKKISNFQNINILYIALKHVIWRFRIRNYFCEISKFRDFTNTLRNFTKSVSAQGSVIFYQEGGALENFSSFVNF